MERRTTNRFRPRPAVRRDSGLAMVEFAIVGVLLFVLLFGIIGFGVLLSTKNSITQAANEGARSSVSVFARNGLAYADLQSGVPAGAKILAERAAIDRMRERLSHLEGDVGGPIEMQCSEPASCPDAGGNPSLIYLARVHDCTITDEATITNFAVAVDTPEDSNDCMFTRVIYNHADYRILPTIPFIDATLPDTITDRADVALT